MWNWFITETLSRSDSEGWLRIVKRTRLTVHSSDTLLVRNIAFQNTLVPVMQIIEVKYIRIKRKFYPLQEVRIFEWGSTYNDFMEAVIEMPNQQTLGESMGFQKQDPE